MRLAICSTTNTLDGEVSEFFGRAPFFIIIDTEKELTEIEKLLENKNLNQPSGAGTTAAKLLAENKVEAVISKNIGPRAIEVLKQFDLKSYLGKGSVKEAIVQYRNNELKQIS